MPGRNDNDDRDAYLSSFWTDPAWQRYRDCFLGSGEVEHVSLPDLLQVVCEEADESTRQCVRAHVNECDFCKRWFEGYERAWKHQAAEAQRVPASPRGKPRSMEGSMRIP